MNLAYKGAIAALLLASAATPALAQSSANASGTATAKIIRPITVTKNADLAFGTLVRGAGTATVSNAGARSTGGAVVALSSTTAGNAQFTIDGEGGQAISVVVPTTVTMTRVGGSETLDVTTTNDAPVSPALSNSLGSAGSLVVKVGGSLTLTAATATGDYSGPLVVSASYN